MNLKDFTSKWRYRYDSEQYGEVDSWLIPPLTAEGFEDDCDGFALGVLYYVVCNESLLEFWKQLILGKAKIEYVDNQGGHAVLRYGDSYIDNWTLEWVPLSRMQRLGHVFDKHLYRWYHVAAKMAVSKFKRFI